MAGKLGSGNSKDTSITKKETGTRLGPKAEQGPKKPEGPSIASKVVSSIKKATVSDGEYARWLNNKVVAERIAEAEAKMEAKRKAKANTPTGSQANHHVTTSANTTKKAPTGADAIAELQRQVSPSGVKQAEANAKKAIDKKYPGLYKK